MKKQIILLVLTILLLLALLTACTDHPSTASNQPTEPPTTQKVVASTVAQETTTVTSMNTAPTTEAPSETAPPPTVADDLDYYAMFQEGWDRITKLDVTNGEFQQQGEQYAKKWVSTDGKISFVLKTKYGPFGDSYIHATYTTDGNEYDTLAEISAYQFQLYIDKWDSRTVILYGKYEYNHDEQSFTVTAYNSFMTSNLNDTSPISVEEYNEKYGNTAIPVYHGGEQVTFKMVR